MAYEGFFLVIPLPLVFAPLSAMSFAATFVVDDDSDDE